jgi:hypothetical protein
MPLSAVNQSILDGQLGVVEVISGQHVMVIGVCSGGTVNTCKAYAGNQEKTATTDYGYGPGTQQLCRIVSKGLSASFCKANITTAGACGTIDVSGVTGSSVITASGAARDTYRMKGRVLKGGTIATAGITIQLSLDNGETWGPETPILAATSYLVPNTGVTFAFAAGTLVAGDTWSLPTTEPKWSASDLSNALDAVAASGIEWDFIQIVGSMTATEAATVKTWLDAREAAKKYTAAICETVRAGASNDTAWQTTILTDYATFTSKRMLIGAGECRMISSIDRSVYMRPASWIVTERAVMRDPSKYELGRVKDDSDNDSTGPLDCSLYDPNGNLVSHNEFTQPGLDEPPAPAAIGFCTLRTHPNKGKGVYVSEGKMFAPKGSDFSTFRLRRVMDIACTITDGILTDELQETPAANRNGTVSESYALYVEGECETGLFDQLVDVGRASDAIVVMNRTDNVVQTKNTTVKVSILPTFEEKYITEEIGFVPSLPSV